MNYSERLTQDRRLVILRLLLNAPLYTANDSVITIALSDFGHAVSRDQVRTDLAWLAENGCMTIEDLATIQIATLTQRGVETATGDVITPGVKRPSPQA